MVLDITARDAHDGALKWTTAPSTPRAARSILRYIPVHLRAPLRRALEFDARAPAPQSAEEAEQLEEQLRALADEFFGALLTPVLQRAVRSAAVGDAASALVRHLPRRMRSDGLETVNVRTSRGTTVPVTTPYYREKHARGRKRRPGLYPALVVRGIYDRCTPKLASDASRAVAMLSSLAEAQAQLRDDGIWQRITRLIAALGLSPTQVLGLIDFYHAAKQLSDAVKLRRWTATRRTRWLTRTRGLLKRARVDEVIAALRALCRGRTAGKIRTHLNYFVKNRHRFAYTTMAGLGLPRGSGAIESAIRRVINLRIKGASIYWLPESVEAILLLRSFYKSGRWNCLQRMAMTPVGVSA